MIAICTKIHRIQYEPKLVDGEFLNSIRDKGLMMPIMVRMIPKTRPFGQVCYETICGHLRMSACSILKVPLVPIMIYNLTDEQILVSQIIASSPRVETRPEDYLRAITKLREKYTLAEICTKLDTNPKKLARTCCVTVQHLASL